MEDAGTLYPAVEWFDQQRLITVVDEGIMHEGADDSDRQFLTANGISRYNGGDEITYDGVTNNRWENAAGTDVEETYVDGYYQRTATTSAAYQCIGDALCPELRDGSKVRTPMGFTIGTNTDLNANGEQLVWIAIE